MSCCPPRRSIAPSTIDTDVAALFYTSGSTGKPKGVMLSHRNLVTGARSVSSYLGNTPDDRLLAVLSFSFDYGFSQLSTAFAVGASVVLLDYLLPQEVLLTLERERITGLAAVPPIWIQLADLRWPDTVRETLRYITNSGGTMPRATLAKLRQAAAADARVPDVRPHGGIPIHVPAAGGSRPTTGFDRQGDPRSRSAGAADPTARPAPSASRANWFIAARWYRSATGTTRNVLLNVSGPCRTWPVAGRSRSWQSGPGTSCGAMRMDSSTSSVAATR